MHMHVSATPFILFSKLSGAALGLMVAGQAVAPTAAQAYQPHAWGILSGTLLETLEVPVDGSTVSSRTVLAAGKHYRIEISGTFYVGGPGDQMGDAEYANFEGGLPAQNWCNYNPSDVDLGVSINDPILDNAKFPFWGLPNPWHVYAARVVGTDQPARFTYHDCWFDDNEGSLTVQIYLQDR